MYIYIYIHIHIHTHVVAHDHFVELLDVVDADAADLEPGSELLVLAGRLIMFLLCGFPVCSHALPEIRKNFARIHRISSEFRRNFARLSNWSTFNQGTATAQPSELVVLKDLFELIEADAVVVVPVALGEEFGQVPHCV